LIALVFAAAGCAAAAAATAATGGGEHRSITIFEVGALRALVLSDTIVLVESPNTRVIARVCRFAGGGASSVAGSLRLDAYTGSVADWRHKNNTKICTHKSSSKCTAKQHKLRPTDMARCDTHHPYTVIWHATTTELSPNSKFAGPAIAWFEKPRPHNKT
jgi:hypothetical protein